MTRPQTMCTVDARTDVFYAVAAAECGGLVSCRDFVTARRLARHDIPSSVRRRRQAQCLYLISGGSSIDLKGAKNVPGRLRGRRGVVKNRTQRINPNG